MSDGAKSLLSSSLLIAVSLAALGVTFAHTASLSPNPARGNTELALIAGIVTLFCALPIILSYSIALLVSRSRNARLTYDLSRRAAGDSAPAPELRGACEDAARLWRHERDQVEQTSSRMTHQALFYGFFSTLLLCATALVLTSPFLSRSLAIDTPGQRIVYRLPIAIATAATVLTMFARDTGGMLVRAANRDASAQMLAWSTKRLLVMSTVSILACCLLIAGNLHEQVLPRSAHWVLLGAGMALLGDRATASVTERIAHLLGVPPRLRPDIDTLLQLDGLAEEDAARLAEEGIDGAHALALYATPKLFFNTPYSLHRLCDWQDQALLIARLGTVRARVFRDQLMVRGAIDAQRVARKVLSTESDGGQRSDVQKILGFATETQMRIAMERLATDEVAARLVAYQTAMPQQEATRQKGES